MRIIAAFESGKMFPIGTSMTTGLTDTVTYGSIHLKSAKRGGQAVHGWPDVAYFRIVNEEQDAGNVPRHE